MCETGMGQIQEKPQVLVLSICQGLGCFSSLGSKSSRWLPFVFLFNPSKKRFDSLRHLERSRRDSKLTHGQLPHGAFQRGLRDPFLAAAQCRIRIAITRKNIQEVSFIRPQRQPLHSHSHIPTFPPEKPASRGKTLAQQKMASGLFPWLAHVLASGFHLSSSQWLSHGSRMARPPTRSRPTRSL